MKLIFFLLSGSVLFFQVSFAQNNPVKQDLPPVPTFERRQTAIVADVDVTDLTATTTKSTIEGGFLIKNNIGTQQGIFYGLVVETQEGGIFNIVNLGSINSLREGETKKVIFSTPLISIPEKGKVFLRVENEAGLSLGSALLSNKVDLLTISRPDFICTQQESAFLVCQGKEASYLQNVTVARTFFGNPLEEGFLFQEGPRIKTHTSKLSPGRYYASIYSKDKQIVAVVPFTVLGVFAQVGNIIVAKKEGETAPLASILVEGFFLKEYQLAVSLTDSAGNECFSTSVISKDRVFALPTDLDCSSGFITVTVKNKEGLTLATKTESYNIMPVVDRLQEKASTTQKKANDKSFFIGVIVIMFMILICLSFVLYVRYYRHRNSDGNLQEKIN